MQLDPCPCSRADFECGIGFELASDGKTCQPTENQSPPPTCVAPEKYSLQPLIRIPNDECEGSIPGAEQAEEKVCPEKLLCAASCTRGCVAHNVCRAPSPYVCGQAQCQHGTCSTLLHCECEDGWLGPRCDEKQRVGKNLFSYSFSLHF